MSKQYDQHKAYIQMADISRSAVEDVLHNMRQKLKVKNG